VKQLAYALLLSSCSIYASPILVTSPSQLNMTDVLDWSQFGGDKTALQQNFYASTTSMTDSGYSVSVAGKFANGTGSILSAGTDALSGAGIDSGDALLATNTGNRPDGISLSFAGTYGAGAYLELPSLGQFTVRIQAFAGMNSVYDMAVTSTGTDPLFVGVLDNKSDITRVVYSLVSMPGSTSSLTGNFMMDKFYLQNTSAAPTVVLPQIITAPVTVADNPEPGMLSLMGLGCLAIGWKLRKRANAAK
jgi:hypothetical protein